MSKKLADKTKEMLDDIVGSETASTIFNNMFPPPIQGYKKGKILTVGELKKLPENTVIHLWYKDDDGELRTNDYHYFAGFDGNEELTTNDGFPMPMEGHEDNEPIDHFNNAGWAFTVREAIKK